MADTNQEQTSGKGERGGSNESTTFVDYVPGTRITRGIPRLSHKKSRTGCQRCRARRVKVRYKVLIIFWYCSQKLVDLIQCDEAHPVCGGCNRHRVSCVYGDPIRNSTLDHPYSVQHSKKATELQSKPEILEEPESTSSRQRRLLELRLMHQWTTKTAMTFNGNSDQVYRTMMTQKLAEVAFANDALLNTLCSFAALHIAKTATDPSERADAMDAYRKYLDMALRGHQIEIKSLSKTNADAICLTSSMIRNSTMATLADRPIDPYVPPTDWFHMWLGSREVFSTAWAWVGDDETSMAKLITERKPDMKDVDALFHESNGNGFMHLLERSPNDKANEPWDDEIQEAYRLVICYIGGIQIAMNANETADELTRRAVGFGLLIPKRFINLMDEARPRALVVLAHYFALLAKLRDIWWIGDTGRREVRAINSELSGEWQRLMSGPLMAIEESPIPIEMIYP